MDAPHDDPRLDHRRAPGGGTQRGGGQARASLKKGDLAKAMRYTKATVVLNELATQVADTEFLDELR